MFLVSITMCKEVKVSMAKSWFCVTELTVLLAWVSFAACEGVKITRGCCIIWRQPKNHSFVSCETGLSTITVFPQPFFGVVSRFFLSDKKRLNPHLLLFFFTLRNFSVHYSSPFFLRLCLLALPSGMPMRQSQPYATPA